MKTTKLTVTGILASGLLTLTCISSYAYVGPTNFMAYNFDSSAQVARWQNWFGGDYVTNVWDPTQDSSNNPASGSMLVEVNYQGGLWVLWDGAAPSYSPLPLSGLIRFTNLQFDVKYYSTAPGLIRTNVSPWDFGDARVGTLGPSYAQDWYYYYAVPATNGLGQPNTNWFHINIDLSQLPVQYPGLANSGLGNIMLSQDDAGYGNNVLSGTQLIWFDNIQFNGWVSPVPGPTMSIQKASPGLDLFPGTGIYGRSQLQISTNYLSDGWIGAGTTYPVSYSWTMADNATTPGGLDTHLTFLPSPPDTPEGISGADYQQANCLWLQLISGSGTNTSCVGNFSWKTNDPGCNPNAPHTNALGVYNGGVVLWFTNSVRAGTWTVTFDSPTNGSITTPGLNSMGVNPIPFNLSSPTLTSNAFGTNYAAWANLNKIAPALAPADAIANFSNPMYIRIGDMNYGNGSRTQPDVWNSISVSGTAGTNFTFDFTKQGFNLSTAPSGLDTNLWDLTSSDGGAAETIQVPTNAPYWIVWQTNDNGYYLGDATNLNGPWNLVYTNGVVPLYVPPAPPPTQTVHGGYRWNLMLIEYLPTANGGALGPLSPDAYFRLSTNAPPQ